MEDLMQGYKDSRTNLIKARESLKNIRDELKEQKLSKMANLTLPTTFEQQRIETEQSLANIEADLKTMGEMISDIEYVLEWIGTGRRPGNRRGIERRAAYQKVKLLDPLRMQAFCAKSTAGSSSNLSDWQIFQIEDALSRLSERERECYVLAYGECFSHSEVAELLGISKNAVEEYIRRAQRKISEDLNNSLFLIN